MHSIFTKPARPKSMPGRRNFTSSMHVLLHGFGADKRKSCSQGLDRAQNLFFSVLLKTECLNEAGESVRDDTWRCRRLPNCRIVVLGLSRCLITAVPVRESRSSVTVSTHRWLYPLSGRASLRTTCSSHQMFVVNHVGLHRPSAFHIPKSAASQPCKSVTQTQFAAKSRQLRVAVHARAKSRGHSAFFEVAKELGMDPELCEMMFPHLPENMRTPEAVKLLMNDPEFQKRMDSELAQMHPDQYAFNKPEVVKAVMECAEDPSKLAKHQHEPEVRKVLQQTRRYKKLACIQMFQVASA